jgi:hypothetical protein
MPNLKNITDLPVVESADGLNLIVEDNGSAKRIAADRIEGKVKSVNGIMPDENGNVKVETASSWNDLTDKPFYEETKVVNTLEWDGSTAGRTMIMGNSFCKVCDCVLTADDLRGAIITSTWVDEDIDEQPEVEELTDEVGFPCFKFATDEFPTAGYYFGQAFPEEGIPEGGLYLSTQMQPYGYISKITFTNPIEATTTKKIDEKYLPDAIAKIADIDAKVDEIDKKIFYVNIDTDGNSDWYAIRIAEAVEQGRVAFAKIATSISGKFEILPYTGNMGGTANFIGYVYSGGIIQRICCLLSDNQATITRTSVT